MTKSIELLLPVPPARAEQIARAPRLARLEGAAIVLLDNTKQNADVFMEQVERELQARFGVQRVRRLRKFDSAKPATGFDDLVRGADAIINGIGD